MSDATEADIGKLCRFYNEDSSYNIIGILTDIWPYPDTPYECNEDFVKNKLWKHARRLKKEELETLL